MHGLGLRSDHVRVGLIPIVLARIERRPSPVLEYPAPALAKRYVVVSHKQVLQQESASVVLAADDPPVIVDDLVVGDLNPT